MSSQNVYSPLAFKSLSINRGGTMYSSWRAICRTLCLALVVGMMTSCGGSDDSTIDKSSAQVRLVLSSEAQRLTPDELDKRLRELDVEVISRETENGSVVLYGSSISGESGPQWVDHLAQSPEFLQVSSVPSSVNTFSTGNVLSNPISAKAMVQLAATPGQLYEAVPLKWGIGNVQTYSYIADSPLASCRLYQQSYISMNMVTDMKVGSAGLIAKHTGTYTLNGNTPVPDYVLRPAAFCQWTLNYFGIILNQSYNQFTAICEPYGSDHIYGPDYGINAPSVCLKKVDACPVGHVVDADGICRDTGISPVEIPENSCELGMRTPNPILPASGEKIFQRKDVADAAPHGLNLTLTYRTQWKLSPLSSAGAMWGHNHGSNLRTDPLDPSGNSLILQKGDGSHLKFSRLSLTSPWVNKSHGGILEATTLEDGTPVLKFTDKQSDTNWIFSQVTTTGPGRLLSATQRNGWSYRYLYNSSSRLSQVVNNFGRELNFSYHESGLLAGVTAPDGRTTRYFWDSDARLIHVTYPDATFVRYVYEDQGRPQFITGVFDETNKRLQSVSYDSLGRATVSTLAGNVERYSVEYGSVGAGLHSQATIRDPLGTERSFSFAQTNGRTAVTGGSQLPGCNGEPPVASRTQNPLGLPDKEFDHLGNVTSYGWDNTRMLLTSVEQGVGKPEVRTTSIQWHANFALPSSILEPTKSTAFTYDAAGRLLQERVAYYLVGDRRSKTQIKTFTYDAAGLLASKTEPNGAQTTYVNNALGLPETITNALNQVTRINYDPMGRPTRVEQPDGLIRTLAYNDRGWLISSTEGDGSTSLTTTYSYTLSGQVKTLDYPSGYVLTFAHDDAHRVVGWSDNRGQSASYTLDAAGNATQETISDSDGQVALQVSREINQINRLNGQTVGGNQATGYTYDGNGRLRGIQDAAGNSTILTRDAHARVIAITNALNQSAGLAYNGADALVGASDFLRVNTGHARDALGNALTEVSTDSGNFTNTWDSLNLLSKRVDAASRTSTFTRDRLGRPIYITYSASGLPTILQSITYDTCRVGRVCVLDEKHNGVSSSTLHYQWDAFGRITQRNQEISSTLGSPHTLLSTSYAYVVSGAGAGQLASITYPSGNVLSYVYNATGQLRELQWNGQPLLENIVYNALGQPKGWTWAFADASSATSLTASRSYSSAGQLSSAEWGSFSYNALGQVQSLTQQQFAPDGSGGWASQTVNYAMVYDSLGRLTGLASSNAGGALLGSYGYAYDANGNRLDKGMSVLVGSNRLGRIGTELVTHNTAGDMTELTESKLAMSYDAAARMSSTAHVPTGSGCADPLDCQVEIWHWYNAQGQRVLRDGVDGQTAYAYGLAGHEVLGEYGNAGRSSEHIWLPTASGPMPVAAVINGEHFAVHVDHLNTPRRLTDKNGVARWQWVYSGYGEAQAQSLGAALGYSLRYPGQVDDGNGLHYNWHRFYQPQTGRYTQGDPIGLEGGWNRFTYVGGNPLLYVDPTGLLNPAKGVSALGNATMAGFAAGSGGIKMAVAIGLSPAATTGVGALPPLALASWSAWNFKSSVAAWGRARQQWDEAMCEKWGDANLKNFWGLAPGGTHYDDPAEPNGPLKYIETKGWWHFLSEAGVF